MMNRIPFLERFGRGEQGAASIEFALVAPLMLGLLFSAIDFGVVMLRQVYLDRAVDIASREVRLGENITTYEEFRDRICANTYLVRDCQANISIEMRPINTATWAGLNAPAQCVDRANEVAPLLEFNPGMGAQELMLIRVCLMADPFINATGYVMGLPLDPSGRYAMVSRSAWVNEPR